MKRPQKKTIAVFLILTVWGNKEVYQFPHKDKAKAEQVLLNCNTHATVAKVWDKKTTSYYMVYKKVSV